MRKTLNAGLLMGFILTFLSWMATLLSGALPMGWLGGLTSGVSVLTLAGWFWLGWRLATREDGPILGAFAGIVSGLVYGLLVGVVQAVFVGPAASGQAATFSEGLLGSLGAIVGSTFLGGVIGLAGGSAGRLYRRQARARSLDDVKGD